MHCPLHRGSERWGQGLLLDRVLLEVLPQRHTLEPSEHPQGEQMSGKGDTHFMAFIVVWTVGWVLFWVLVLTERC